ncbi:inturned isoform X1 [Brachionus plicatilis]|uniref:Inturned isoform X1 n=1 Tax=Brachionus plicatilis TaxID=10195 RepID=A0A3M7PY86_BRAPC|nr:inturned isoform X1 [Brachionus plicatilis]
MQRYLNVDFNFDHLIMIMNFKLPIIFIASSNNFLLNIILTLGPVSLDRYPLGADLRIKCWNGYSGTLCLNDEFFLKFDVFKRRKKNKETNKYNKNFILTLSCQFSKKILIYNTIILQQIISFNKFSRTKFSSSKLYIPNDLIYSYPRVDTDHAYRKLNNTILSQLIEVIRGLFMTLSTIDYQGMILNVCFLHKNFGNKGLLVIIVPGDQIDAEYFKTLAKNLNATYKFTFGSQTLSTLVNPSENLESKNLLRFELDAFFNHFHKRLIQSSLFSMFNANSKNLSFYEKVWCYNEMKTKVFDSIPFFELPTGLKIDLETVLSDLESQETVDLGGNDSGYRRLFHVYGSCLFFQNNLLVSHFDESVTKLVFNFCDHYNYFNHTKNGNHFRIWREVEVEQKMPNSRHFLILIGLSNLGQNIFFSSLKNVKILKLTEIKCKILKSLLRNKLDALSYEGPKHVLPTQL